MTTKTKTARTQTPPASIAIDKSLADTESMITSQRLMDLGDVIESMQPCDISPGALELRLSRVQSSNLKALHLELMRRHAKTLDGRFVDPNNKASAIRWLLEMIGPRTEAAIPTASTAPTAPTSSAENVSSSNG